jgi:hypothetical protein
MPSVIGTTASFEGYSGELTISEDAGLAGEINWVMHVSHSIYALSFPEMELRCPVVLVFWNDRYFPAWLRRAHGSKPYQMLPQPPALTSPRRRRRQWSRQSLSRLHCSS